MSAEDWIGDFDPADAGVRECQFCGDGPFYWEETSSGWRLVDADGKVHHCKRQAGPLDFRDLDA